MTGRSLVFSAEFVLASVQAGSEGAPVDSGESLVAFLAGAAIASFLLSIAAFVAYAAKVYGAGSVDSPTALFRDLCNAHRLDPEDREILLDAAAAAQIRGVEVFVRPEALSDLADKLDDPDAKSRCWRLRRKLFGDLRPDPKDEYVA